MKRTRILLGLAALLLTGAANANIIYYEVVSLGGTSWQYNYTVDNSGGTNAVDEFTIWFDVGLFENLAITGSPTDWDPIEVQPDPFLGDGFADWLALVAPISAGGVLGGFSVMFDYLGAGTPGSQFFDYVDPFTFDVLFSGETTLRISTEPPVTVPEPSTVTLFGIGLIAFLLAGRRQRTRKN